MLTSSISDEDLQECTSDINEQGIITGSGPSPAKSPVEGIFQRLVSSQRDFRPHQGERSWAGEDEKLYHNLDTGLHKHENTEIEYDRAFKHSLENPEQFWAEVGHELTWFKPWDQVLDNSNPPFTKWFVGGMLNACYNAVDRHVENGFGERVAIIHDSPVTSTVRHITYLQLLEKVSLLAGVYSSIGVKKGDRVLIYMPMIPEAIISMLAAARLGAIHSVVFGGFAARELRTRIEHAEPTVIVAASCGVEPNKIVRYRYILQEALLQSLYKPMHIIMFERPEIPLVEGKNEKPFEETIVELDWDEAIQSSFPHECVPVEANEPLYILYTSGTTDNPKGVVRPVGGHLATLSWTMHAVYGMKNVERDPKIMCNGEALAKFDPSSQGLDESSFKKKNSKSDCDCNEQQKKEGENNSSINKIEMKSKVTIKANHDQSETDSMENPNVWKEQSKEVRSNEQIHSCMKPIDKEENNHLFSNLNEVQDNCENKSSCIEKNPSKLGSNNFLHKICFKMHQLLTGTKENKGQDNENCSHKHASTNEGFHELKLEENNIMLSAKCSLNHASSPPDQISKNAISMPLKLQNDNVLKTRAHNLEDSKFKQSDSKSKGSQALIKPSMKPNCIKRNVELKSAELPNKTTQMKIGLNQVDMSICHEDFVSNQFLSHYPSHSKCSKSKSDLHENVGENSQEHCVKIIPKKLHQTKSNSFNLPNCKNKNKSQTASLGQIPYSQNKVWWAASDMGWVVGHSYVCYAPLTAGLTSVMYEGKPDRTPDPGQYFRVIEQHKVNAILTAPTALRVIKRVDPSAIYGKKYSTKSLKTIFVAGESLDQSTKSWTEKIFKVNVVNHWWQTETGHSITATCIGLGHSSSQPPSLSTGKPFPGFDLCILRDDGSEAAVGEEGRIAARLPLPPGTLSTLYKDPRMFKSLYFSSFPGYYDTMDAGYIIPDPNSSIGWIVVTGREDDVVSVAGHRLSASAIEAVALQHSNVSDALVVGVPDRTKGEIPLCLYVPTPGWKKDGEGDNDAAQRISNDLIHMVRELLGPIAAFRLSFPVPALPKTRSGKIPRKSIARMARGLPLKIPSTVEDPLVYEDINAVLQTMRFSK